MLILEDYSSSPWLVLKTNLVGIKKVVWSAEIGAPQTPVRSSEPCSSVSLNYQKTTVKKKNRAPTPLSRLPFAGL